MEYISIRQILDNLLADPIMHDLSLERAVNYAIEFIKIVGMPKLFTEKTASLTTSSYRASLPSDFLEVIQVIDAESELPIPPAYRASTSTTDPLMPGTYKIQGSVIITSEEEVDITLVYRALNVDTEGFPVILDNGTFSRALELYIQKRYFTILFNSGKITAGVLQNIQQEYAFAVGQAQADLVRPTIDEMESITNMLNSFIHHNKHINHFEFLGKPEYIRH